MSEQIKTDRITHFPPAPVVAHPVEIYTQIIYPQITAQDRPRVYTPGPITSGWYFAASKNMPQVIAENSIFATQFVEKQLLDEKRPVRLQTSSGEVSFADMHITVPHALGKCLYPAAGQEETQLKWGQFDYYIVWLMTIAGLEPTLAPHFAEALGKDVDISVINNLLGARETRITEVQKVFGNTIRFVKDNENRTKPVTGVVALPEPLTSHQEISIGSLLEAQVAKALNLPLKQLLINLDKLKTVMHEYDGLWDGLVAQWMLRELALSPSLKSEEVVVAADYRHLDPW